MSSPPPGGRGSGPAMAHRAHALLIAGGRARRFGADKTRAHLDAASLLEHAVAGLPPGLPVLVVGPAPAVDLPWVRESPAYGGPVAALAAGCAAAPPDVEVLVVLAGDQPFGGSAVPRLLAALDDAAAECGAAPERGVDAAIGVDPDGRRQPLLAAYRRRPLEGAVGASPSGRALRDVVAALRVVEVPVSAREALDVDTPEDLDKARRALSDSPRLASPAEVPHERTPPS